MSVEIGLFVVDWVSFAEGVDGGEEPFGLVEDLDSEPLAPSTLQAQDEFLEAVARMKKELSGEVASALESLFHRLFWSWQEGVTQTLDVGEAEQGLDLVLSPGSVRGLAPVAGRVDAGEAAAVFDRVVGKTAEFDGAPVFRRYLEAWTGAIERAAEADRGIVVLVWS